jgi:predicted Zn-dependent peptidase
MELPMRPGIAVVLFASLGLAAGCATTAPQRVTKAPVAAATSGLKVPVEYYKLANGLKVVLSQDHSVPVATVAVYYNIGFRIEPRDRTGFAHLFEHMMFQGSANLGKNEFFRVVQSMGGTLNGSTRFDFTNYYAAFPSNAVETLLWAEADRMRSLEITQENLTNQQGVVKSEVRVNVLNRPYGGFPWLDIPQYANQNWYNAHNFYGDLGHLDAATLQDVQDFFNTYYAPNNAALVVVGDFDPVAVRAWIQKYYGPIAARVTPAKPDLSEPAQTAERRATKMDPLVPRPAMAIAYHVPERWTPDHFAFGLLDEILLQGDDSRLHQDMVQRRGLTSSISGGINLLGNMFNYSGPMLWTASLIHDPAQTDTEILAAFDSNIERITHEPVTQEELDRARTQIRSSLYDLVGSSTRFGLADLLACFALFDDDPTRINQIESEFAKVTPAMLMQTASRYLRPESRTILQVLPDPTKPTAAGATR